MGEGAWLSMREGQMLGYILVRVTNGIEIQSRHWIFLLQLASPPGKYQLVNHTLSKVQPLDFK